MKVSRPISFLLFLSLILFTVACSPTITEEKTMSFNCEADGPFFAGANSLMANYKVDLGSLVSAEQLDPKKLKSVKLKGIQLKFADDAGMNMADFNSASLQLVSDEVEMLSIGVKNPLTDEGLSAALDVSDEADISEYFQQEAFTLVLDLDFKEDSYNESLMAEVEMKLELSYVE